MLKPGSLFSSRTFEIEFGALITPAAKILFLIPALDQGGTERQLVELVKAIDKSRFAVCVATFYGGGELRPEIESIHDVQLLVLKKEGRSRAAWSYFRLWTAARKIRPDVMIGYLNLPAILCSLVGRAVRARVVWCLRSSEVDYARYGWGMRWSFKLGAYLSRFADLVILNSVAGEAYHRAKGYRDNRMMVISNGIDTTRFRPIAGAGSALREQWAVRPGEILIGLVGRLDHMKDHPTFLQAAAKLAAQDVNVKFVCVGGGTDEYAAQLRRLAADLGLNKRLVWAGDQHDMITVYNALDILVSSSSGEGFSNVIGEAMASGVPVVVSDVGDSALIVGDTGIIVPPGDAAKLASALSECVNMSAQERAHRQVRARDRIEREFNVHAMVKKMEDAIEELMVLRGERTTA